jgi:hypothetical protein
MIIKTKSGAVYEVNGMSARYIGSSTVMNNVLRREEEERKYSVLFIPKQDGGTLAMKPYIVDLTNGILVKRKSEVKEDSKLAIAFYEDVEKQANVAVQVIEPIVGAIMYLSFRENDRTKFKFSTEILSIE